MENQPVIVRTYSENDEEYVTNLMRALCNEYNVEFDEKRWKLSLEKKFKNSDIIKLFVAEHGKKVIGMLVADIRRVDSNERAGYITNLIVAPDFRNMGVGEQLLTKATEFFKEQHVVLVKVNVLAGNESAERLFAKFGFKNYAIQLRKAL